MCLLSQGSTRFEFLEVSVEARTPDFSSRLATASWTLFATGALLPILVTLQLVGSVAFREAVLISLIVVVQTFGGSLLWVWIKRSASVSWVEVAALGIPLGAVLGLLAHQIFLGSQLSWIGWAIPTVIVVIGYLLTPTGRTRIRPPSFIDAFGLGLVIMGALMLAGRVWFTTPLNREGWFAFFGDIPIHEAMANTLGLRGPSESLMLLDGNLRYHWFANAWAGSLSVVADASPFVTLTRTLFSVAIVGGALLAWTLAPLFIRGRWARTGAGLCLFLGTTVFIGVGNPGSPILEKFSPTIAFGALCLLAASYVILNNLQNQTTWASLIVVFILGVGVVGGRITLGVVSVGGAVSVLCLAIILQRQRWATFLNLAALGAGFVVALVILTAQVPIASQVNPWVIEPNIEAASLWSLIPFYNLIGYAAALVAVVAVVCAQASGVVWTFLSAGGARNPANYWVTGILLFGFLGVFFTRQLGYAQMTFLGSAIIAALVASGAGTGAALEFLYRQATSTRRVVVVSFLGLFAALLLGLFAVGVTQFIIGFRYFGPTRWALPFLLWIGAALIGYLLLKVAGVVPSRRNSAAAGISLLVITTMLTPVWQITQQIREDSGVFTVERANIVQMGDFEAAEWIRLNTAADSIWATNRMCSVVGELPPDCPSTSYVVSALAKRQALIEGHTYSVGADLMERANEFDWAIQRIENSYNFGLDPNKSNAKFLWDQGVRYFWVDTAVQSARSWSPFGRVIYRNPRAILLQITEPETW